MEKLVLFSFILFHILQIKAYDDCNEPLLEKSKIYSSTSMSSDRGPDKGRLNGLYSWTAGYNDYFQYLTFKFRSRKIIHRISTQGHAFSNEFVSEYCIQFSNDGDSWRTYISSDGEIQLFTGNVDGDTIKLNKFDMPIIAQWIRINPTRWRDRISMRVELYGCDYVSESVNFDGKSYFTKELYYPIASESEMMRFRFRTNHADGLILYSRGSQGDFVALQLLHNKLLLNIDLGGEGLITSVSVGSLLDDNMWHDVSIMRSNRDITFTVDRVVVPAKIRGDFLQLNIKREINVGGISNFNNDGIMVHDNFTGCIENLFFNNTNFISELKEKKRDYQQYGDLTYTCLYEQVIPVTFLTSEAHLKLSGYKQSIMNCSFDFRTFTDDGLLLYNKFSQEGFVKVFLDKGKIKIELQSENTPKVVTEASERFLSDGLWHRVMLILQTNRIELHVDDKPSVTTRQFSMLTGDEYFIGGGVYGNRGFIGCMRYIHIEGHYIRVTSLPSHRYSAEGVVFDACQMTDRCNPNPCEHGGICHQNSEEFKCACENTGYSGAVCHIPIHSLSCEAYKLTHPKTRDLSINIDIDGSGPLGSFPVTCEFPFEGPAVTILHHKNERPTDVKGFNKPGSYIQNIIYNAEMEQIVQLVNRSYNCHQKLRYECYKTRLFSSPAEPAPFEPFSWWVSRNNRQMDYWGGSLPGSRKCNCGLYGTCKDPTKWCNCDSDNLERDKWLVDEGDLTQKEFLPVRQLRFGDTGTTMDDKKGRYSLGPLKCEGDNLFDNTVTFYYEDATIDLPTFDMGHSGDIYFQFKTTAQNGVLVSSRGPTDYIKIMLIEGDQIQFQYQGGNGPLGVSAETSYKLNDNNWHSVLVERNRKEARVVIDGSLSAEVKERSGPVRALYLTSKLVIGATVDYREGFVGCLRALMLNGIIVDLQRMASDYSYGIGNGCFGKCQSSPCLNNGTCIEGYSSYICDCQWTGFKGPICADEIGVNLRSDYYIRYNFDNRISTLEEYIRVGFTTTDKTGMIVGVSSFSGEYLNLMMSTSGHLRLVFDFGFERQEIIIKNENFALGQHHDIRLLRGDKGAKITIYVDNYEPIVHTFKIDEKADAQFNSLKSIYVGRNESMGTGEGFVGCISRVQFDDHFPLRRLFQESRRANVWSVPVDIREDDCGIEPVTHPPEYRATRPPPTLPPGVRIEAHRSGEDDSAILGGVLALIFIALILMAVLIGRYMSRHKGEYKTHEDTGAKDAPDADTAVRLGKTGHGVPKKEEWFI
ncbi:neurexin-4 isoform X2 [Parasteatoda tepidariorum]|uniref:neurexin-4 isoform X2 n=1 Tax=Parasteatoda tepidariorum TaxID=114398 RepID=UPI001C7192FB|nr:neurexin-4 isoform X3 [Parasteatoda tepidariorum]